MKIRYENDPTFRNRKIQVATKHYEDNRERRKEQNYATAVKRNYGLTTEQIQAKARAQEGVCMLCKRPPEVADPRRKKLCVDHNHETGKARDLLCSPCNSALGFFKENVAVLARAIEYLNRHNGAQ